MEVEPESWCLIVTFFFSIIQFCKCHRVGAFDHLVMTLLSPRGSSKCQIAFNLHEPSFKGIIKAQKLPALFKVSP